MQEEDAREVRKGNVEGGKASVKGKGPKGKGKGPKGALGILVSSPSSGPVRGLEQREVEKERAFLEGKAMAT